ncbi:MAG TPA: methionyl-tRNA formyltransferase [Acidimicrobiales bacterium]|nr:methionyl-tRNA formyltransferase [Acidimicrobiales bacterium]
MKIAFLGTPEVSAMTLRALVGAGHEVRAVITRPDKRRGRGEGTSPSPLKAAAAELGLPVAYLPSEVLGKGADLGVVVAYGRVIKPDVLAHITLVNVHFSLLPRWRGAAPVERAILAGDERTGVCLMRLEEGLDTGPVYALSAVPIGPDETACELRERLAKLGTDMLLAALGEGLPVPVPQVGEPSYAAKLEAKERRLDFAQTGVVCNRVVRVGKAWTTFRGKRLLVHRARVVRGSQAIAPGEIQGTLVGTAGGLLELLEVQAEGKAAMPAAEWARGARLQPGERFGA